MVLFHLFSLLCIPARVSTIYPYHNIPACAYPQYIPPRRRIPAQLERNAMERTKRETGERKKRSRAAPFPRSSPQRDPLAALPLSCARPRLFPARVCPSSLPRARLRLFSARGCGVCVSSRCKASLSLPFLDRNLNPEWKNLRPYVCYCFVENDLSSFVKQ